jgi:hypothetical protein
LDPIESESELNTTEEPLSGPATALVITSTPVGRFVYWLDRKPVDLTDDNLRCVAYLETLPFQEETPLAPNEDEHTPTEVATTDSSLCTPDCEVFMAVGDTGTSENRSDRYLDDILDEESTNTPPTRLPKTRTLGVTATGSELIDVDVSGKLSPSGTSMRLWIKLPTGCTLPLGNVLCL